MYISRRISLGHIRCPSKHPLVSVNHVASSQISLSLVEGKNNRNLECHTIFDFDRNPSEVKFLSFGQRNTAVYQLFYVVEPMKYYYSFILNSVTCLKQQRWTSVKLFADVEMNFSSQNVNTQPTNRYWLGYFQNYESSQAYSSHHCILFSHFFSKKITIYLFCANI